MARNENINVIISGNSKPLTAEMRKAQFRLKSFKKTAMSVAGSMGLMFGGAAILQGISSSIRKIADFEEQMDKVAAVSRATSEEVELLKNNALDLGRTSRFTATEIGSMQEVMARLGKTSSEIIGATKAVSKLSIATSSELAPAAELMVKTMNAFGIGTKESARVANVLAEATAGSALDMEGLAVSMGNVAATGKAAGFSLEETTAMLGLLIDNGIDASKAGTDLRKIFTEISVNGLTLTEALYKIQTAENKVATSFNEFGIRAQTSAIILADNTEKLDKFTKSLSDTNLEMYDMVRIMEDNLNNDLKLLGSAFDAVIQEGGALNKFFRAGVQVMTQFLQGNFTVAGMMEAAAEAAKKEADELKRLTQIQNTADAAFKSGNLAAYIKQLEKEGNRGEELIEIRQRMALAAKEQADAQIKYNAAQAETNRIAALMVGMDKNDAITELQEMVSLTEQFAIAQERLNNAMEMASPPIIDYQQNAERLGKVLINARDIMEQGVSNAVVGLAQAMGEASQGTVNFGDAFLKVVGGFLQQIGAAFITAGISIKTIKENLMSNPITAVIGGGLMVAAGAALSASVSKSAKNLGGGGGGVGSRANDTFRSHSFSTDPIQVQGEFTINGDSLVAVIGNTNNNTTRTGGRKG